ncbi:hypothetical protein Taro_015720 [Colocasia esculenta]|uniref:ABC1 atypical kinase-like domain-containing protein n=1 Tax=Colocasia esculenta TaxID=4460 RepID=A0A843UN21_COLES|nr:hypothetical protein [Colocasia esculenta]
MPSSPFEAFRDRLLLQLEPWHRSIQFWVRVADIYTGYKACQFRTAFLKDAVAQEAMWERQHEVAADKLYSMCYELGGFFLKVVQILGGSLLEKSAAQLVGKPDLAPAAWVRKLVILCDKAPATPLDVVQQILVEELGQSFNLMFERFDADPVGSASIAQVTVLASFTVEGPPFRFPSLWKATVQVSFTMEVHRLGFLHYERSPFRFPSLWKAIVQVPFTTEVHRSGFLHHGRSSFRFPSLRKGHRSGSLHCGRPPFRFPSPWDHGRSPFKFPSLWKGHRSGSLHCGRPPFRFHSPWKSTVQVFCTMGGHRSGFIHCGRATVQVPFTVEGHRSGFLHHGSPPFRFSAPWEATVQVSFTVEGPPFRFPSLWKATVQVSFTMGVYRSGFSAQWEATVQVSFTVEGPPFRFPSLWKATVHRARVRGAKSDVAVKVQHPGVYRLMMTDIRNLQSFALFLQKTEIKFDLFSLTKEVEKQVGYEFDFLREAQAMEKIYHFLQSKNKKMPVLVPRVFRGLVTRRVLVMDFLEGIPIANLGAEMARRGINPGGKIATAAKQYLMKEYYLLHV